MIETVPRSKKTNTGMIDIFKLIMAILVIAIHTRPLVQCDNTIINTIFDRASKLAVPFFFLSSGYLLGIKSDGEHFERSFVILSLRKTIKMYLIWTAIYFPLAVVGFVKNNDSLLSACAQYLRGVFLVGENYNSWPLWYLLSAIYSYIVIAFFTKCGFGIKGIAVLGCCSMAIGITCDWLIETTMTLPSIITLLRKAISVTIINGRLFRGLLYIAVGFLLSRYKVCTYIAIIGAVLGLLIACIFDGVVSSVAIVLCSIALFCIVIAVDVKNSDILLCIRKISTDMYFLHMWIWTIYYIIVYGEKRYGFDSFMVVTLVCTIISIVAQYVRQWYSSKTLPSHKST